MSFHAVELLRDGPPAVSPAGAGPKRSTVRRLARPVERDAGDAELLGQVTGYYEERPAPGAAGRAGAGAGSFSAAFPAPAGPPLPALAPPEPAPAPAPAVVSPVPAAVAEPVPAVASGEASWRFGERRWRVRGLAKASSFEALRVNVIASAGGLLQHLWWRDAGVRGGRAGRPLGQAIEVPGLRALNKDGDVGVGSVSCAPAGSCSAGGSYTGRRGRSQGFVVSQTGQGG